MNRELVDMKHVKNINDIKLLQAGWIYDINFKPTFDLIKERRYVEKIRAVFPEMNEINEIFNSIISLFKYYFSLKMLNED